ncbi:MAG: hypothetical protein COA73_15355 [Candidatus Hydrogenedentota bacterium]|nr:MAG: hypothetical protein COA73_15355 [Candidatus Hydrogenedentota bacterium]
MEGLGATVIEFPCIEICTTSDSLDLDPHAFDWVVFVSANAVRSLQEKMALAGTSFAFGEARISSVGPATEEALADLGIQVQSMPETYTAEDAFEALHEIEPYLKDKRVLLPQGNLANTALRDALVNAGAAVTAPIVYETICPEFDVARADALVDARPDWVTFTSGSTARHFAQLLGEERLARLAKHTRYASIGPQTTHEAELAGLSISAEPSQHDIPGLITALVEKTD